MFIKWIILAGKITHKYGKGSKEQESEKIKWVNVSRGSGAGGRKEWAINPREST
jgi:hypothetical protein